MFFYDLNYGLLMALGAISWIGLCIFNAFAWSPSSEESESGNSIFDGKILVPVEPQTTQHVLAPASCYHFLDWVVIACVANMGIGLAYHLM